VKRAESATEVKVAWASLSPFERALAKKAHDKGNVIRLDTIRKVASLIGKSACASSCSKGKKKMGKKAEGVQFEGGATKGLKMKKPKLGKMASHTRMVALVKCASFRRLCKTAADLPAPAAAAGAAPSTLKDLFATKNVPDFLRGASGMTPAYVKVIAALGALGVGGSVLGHEYAKRFDRVDFEYKGYGIPQPEMASMMKQLGSEGMRFGQQNAIQNAITRAYNPQSASMQRPAFG
jgi:hypothetical protein